ncbi:MAG: peptidoglycan D,D-transpeptidase FtsI family protein, partial [Planctomycetota bacterium]
MAPHPHQSKPSDPQALSCKRGSKCLALLLILFVGLMGKLTWLAVDQARTEVDRIETRMVSTRAIDRRRGSIVDARGRELAVSVRSYGCAVDPSACGELDYVLSALSGVLKLSPQEQGRIRDYVAQKTLAGKRCRFAWVRRSLNEEEGQLIRALRLKGVIVTPSWRRRYPQGETASHIVGFTDRESRGLEGVEAVEERVLTGSPDEMTVLRDARRRMIVPAAYHKKSGKEALDVVLSLDSVIQAITEQELTKVCEKYKPTSAVALVMNPYTGDLLAMAATPRFDANRAREVDPSVRLNPAVAAVFEPGSVFKPFVVAAALEAGTVKPEQTFHCENGEWNLGFRVLHDTHAYGHLSVSKIIEKSSNIGAAKVAATLGPTRLYRALQSFGFGQRTEISLLGELPGLLAPVERWNVKYAMTSLPMGQEIAVTPLQMVTAFSVLANGGVLLRPRLVRGYRTLAGEWAETFDVKPVRRVLSQRTASQVRGMLGRVVSQGTGRRARCEAYPIGGKT